MAEVPPPAQGQPAPAEKPAALNKGVSEYWGAGNLQEVSGMMKQGEPTGPGQPFSPDKWAQTMKAAGQTTQALTGEQQPITQPTQPGEGLFNAYYEGLKGEFSDEQRAGMARGAREFMKKQIGIKDTADLGPEARKVYDAIREWLTGKGSR